MTELTGKTIANTYKQLLRVGVSTNTGVSAGLTTIESGDGTDSSFQLATNSAKFTGTLVVDGATSIADNLHVDEKVCASAFYGDGSNLSGITVSLATSICVSNALINNILLVNGEATFNSNVSVSGGLNVGGTVTIAGAVSMASTLSVGGAAHFASTVTVVGAATFDNNVSVSGVLNVLGAATFTSQANFKAGVSVSGALNASGNTSVGGTFMATGAATFDNNVSISGGLVVGGTVTIVGANVQAANARVCASAYHGDGSNITNISGAQISGDISVSNLKAAGNVSVGGAFYVGGTVTIAGTNIKAVNAAVCASSFYGDGSNLTNIAASIINSRVAGNFAVSANLSVGGTSNFAGAVSLASTLSVVGAANFASTVTVVGATHLQAAVSVGGATQLSNTLTVGVNDTGHDVKFFGATSGSYMLWDESTDDLILGGAAKLGIGTTSPAYTLDVNGTAALSAGSTEPRYFGIGSGRTGDGYAYIDFVGDATYSSYGLRILRGNTGANTGTSLTHRGTGNFSLNSNEAASILLLTSATERFRITGTGLVGIGVSSPSYLLDLYKSASTVARIRNTASTGGTPSTTHGEFVIESTDGNMGMQFLGSTTADQRILFSDTAAASGQIVYNHTSNYMALYTSAAERMRIDSSGNVGIGTTSPAQFVQISKVTSGGTTALLVSNPSGAGGTSAALKLGVTSEDDSVAKSAIIHERLASYGRGDTYLCSNYTADTTEVTDADAVITIQGSSGSVGIGTTAPLSTAGYGWLTINGASAGGIVSLSNADTELGRLQSTSSNTILNSVTAAPLVFKTNNTEWMRISSTGLVGIGTTSPATTLDVTEGTIRTRYLQGGYDNAAGNFHIDSKAGTAGKCYLNWFSGTGGVFVGNGASSYGTAFAAAFTVSSDRRLKENISYFDSGLAQILQLKPATFDFINGENNQKGFIAQDVETVIPEVIGTTTMPDSSGDVDEADEYLTINNSAIIPYLVAAIQEQHKEIEELKAAVQQLINNN